MPLLAYREFDYEVKSSKSAWSLSHTSSTTRRSATSCRVSMIRATMPTFPVSKRLFIPRANLLFHSCFFPREYHCTTTFRKSSNTMSTSPFSPPPLPLSLKPHSFRRLKKQPIKTKRLSGTEISRSSVWSDISKAPPKHILPWDHAYASKVSLQKKNNEKKKGPYRRLSWRIKNYHQT